MNGFGVIFFRVGLLGARGGSPTGPEEHKKSVSKLKRVQTEQQSTRIFSALHVPTAANRLLPGEGERARAVLLGYELEDRLPPPSSAFMNASACLETGG
jgi:hypothetical protein